MRDKTPQWRANARAAAIQAQDQIAEALMLHRHGCVAFLAAEAVLARCGWEEAEFLLLWAAGDLHV
jgi:hypothetical protein